MQTAVSWLDDFRRVAARGQIVELGHVLHEDIPNSPNHPPIRPVALL